MHRIHGPNAVHIVGLGDLHAAQRLHHSTKQLVGEDGDHRFRKIRNGLMYDIGIDHRVFLKIKF